MSGLLATKVRVSGGALVREWCAPGACGVVIALGAGVACLWSVPGAVSGQGSVGCCQLITTFQR